MKKKISNLSKLLKKLKKKMDYGFRVKEGKRIAPMNAYRGKSRENFWGKKIIDEERKGELKSKSPK